MPPITSTPPASGHPTVVPCLGGGSIHYAGGWQLLGGYAGVDVFYSDGPLLTLRQGQVSYEAAPSQSADGVTWTPLQPGTGYWAYFDQPTDVYFPPPPPPHQTLSVLAQPGGWVLVGDPYDTSALVTGADAVYTYDPVSGYQDAERLHTGQAAFAYSSSGEPITLAADPGH